MATLWDIVTGNSSLPVQAGTTFWDHITNQKTGGGGVDKTFITPFKSTLVNKVKSEVNVAIKSTVSNTVTSSKVTSKLKSKVSK